MHGSHTVGPEAQPSLPRRLPRVHVRLPSCRVSRSHDLQNQSPTGILRSGGLRHLCKGVGVGEGEGEG